MFSEGVINVVMYLENLVICFPGCNVHEFLNESAGLFSCMLHCVAATL